MYNVRQMYENHSWMIVASDRTHNIGQKEKRKQEKTRNEFVKINWIACAVWAPNQIHHILTDVNFDGYVFGTRWSCGISISSYWRNSNKKKKKKRKNKFNKFFTMNLSLLWIKVVCFFEFREALQNIYEQTEGIQNSKRKILWTNSRKKGKEGN